MSTSNERPDLATQNVTSDESKPKQPTCKEFEKKMEELRLRLQTEKAFELERQKEILQKNYEAELQRVLHQKEKELKEARSEAKRVKEGLTLQVRDAERRLAQTPPVCREGISRKLVTEVVELKGVKRRLEEALGDVMDSDKRKASELRKIHDEHAAEMGRFKREAESDIRKLLAELKLKDRIIRQLKRELWVSNERQERLLKHRCQPQSLDKSKTGFQNGGSEKVANTHNLITKNSSSPYNTLGFDRNPNKRKHASNSNQSSDVEDKQHHGGDEPDVKHRERKILKTGQVPENMYCRLYKEHLELQRSFALLRQMITDTKGEKGKCKDVVSLADENQRLQQISQHLKIKIQKLRHELKESRDQNELLEFCVLEMENQGKPNSVPKLIERGTSTDAPNEQLPVLTESTEFDTLVEAYPHKELSEEEAKEIRKNLKCIYTAQGINTSSKTILVQATAQIQAAFTTISNLKDLVIKITKDIEAVKNEKESNVCHFVEVKQNYEECKQKLEETERSLLEVSERLASVQRREATLSHLEQINRRFKEHLQVVLQDFQVVLYDCTDEQRVDVNSLRRRLNELYKIEKEVTLQAEKAGIQQASPNPLEVAKEINVTSKSLDGSSCRDVDSNAETIEELKLELWKQKLVKEEFEKHQKELLQNCNELSLKLAEYEAIKYDLTQKIAILEKSEQDLVEKNLKLYIDYVSAKEDVQKLLVELENRQAVSSSPTSPLELRNIVSIQCSDVQRTLSEESGTMTSEDEGLGEESRRGDSTGPSSLADLQESDDLLIRTSDFESETLDENKSDLETSSSSTSDVGLNKLALMEECAKIKFRWKKEVAELKEREKLLIKQLKHSEAVIAGLHKSIKVKEEQVRQLLGEGCSLGHDKHCEELQQVIKNMQKDLAELEEKLSLTELSKNSLKEQVLELEEAENDARLVGQKLQEKLTLAVQQGNSIQKELEQYKNHLEESHCKIQYHNATEVDLHSQIKYMEFLINKYEDHIKELETSKMKLQQRVFCLEQLLQSAEALASNVHQNTSVPNEYSEGLNCDRTNKISKSLTDFGTSMVELSSPISRSVPVHIDRTSSLCSNLSSYLSINLGGESSPFHKDLVQRLNVLEKDDQTLREQLHQIDGMNLELWKKLHSLENRVGKCMKEYITEMNETSSTHFPISQKCDVPLLNSEESISDAKVKISEMPFETKYIPLTEDLTPSSTQSILQRVLSLETSEHKLKDRLLQLESINREFERELEIREGLYKEKQLQQRKWIEAENALQKTIRILESEKSSLLNKVLRLEEEKLELSKTIENLQSELESLKENHIQALKELEFHRVKALAELEKQQSGFDALTKEKAEKIIELEQSVASLSFPSKIELNMEKYNLLKSELDKLRKDHAALRESAVEHKNNIELVTKDFEKQLNALTDLQKSEEDKLKLEIESLIAKEKEHNLQIIETLQKQTALESELMTKETELEQMKKSFSEGMKLLEDEHHVIEAELKWKMKEMEENAAITIKALTEERSKLENDLQTDLRDLHTKEESYKQRIAELEGCVANLRKEVDQIANADTASNNEKSSLQSESSLFLLKMEELQKNEKQMKEKLAEMEKKEEAYKETLEHAEKIISTLEHNYNEKIEELESSERALKLRVSQLEEVENRLRCTLHNEKRTSEMRKTSDLIEELIEGEIREAALRERIKELETNQKNLIEKLQEVEKSRRYLQEELGDHEEMVLTIEKLRQQQELLKKELLEEQQSKNALQETLDHADDILIQREDELRQKLISIEDEKKELEETTAQLRKQVKELQSVIESSECGKVSPIGEHLYETFSNCDSEEEFQQNDENFYVAERTGGSIEKIKENVEKIKELERIGNDLKQEVSHLKQSLSAANAHLIDLDNINRKQQVTISHLEKEKILLQEQGNNCESLESKYKELEQHCHEEERARLELQKNLEVLQERQTWWEGLKDVNCQLQKQVSLLQKQLNHLNSDNAAALLTAQEEFEAAPYDSNEGCSAIEMKSQAACVIQDSTDSELQHSSGQCHSLMGSTVKNEVKKLAKLCQTVLNSARPVSKLNSYVSDKEDNMCALHVNEQYENTAPNDMFSEVETNINNMPECGRHSPELWSAIPGTVSLDDLTTGLEAQLELEQCVKSAMAAMEREMMQKETSQTPAENCSVNNKSPHVGSTPFREVSSFSSCTEHSSNISYNPKGTITKGKIKILDVSELQQPEKCLSSVIPHPPCNFRILRQVGDNSLLVGWSVPKEGCTIGGYQIYVDGQLHQKVRSPDRTKALLPKINVFQPVNISIYSISTSGHTSEPVSVHHPGALPKAEHPFCKKEMPYVCTTEHSCVLRIRTLYNEGYDVAVQKGSSVLVCSPPDSDGFCTVQVEGQEGKLPFNLLKEMKNSS